jgi:hypothetical protein
LADSFLDFFGNVLPLLPGPQRTRRGRGLQAVGQAPCPSHAGGAQARSAARAPRLSSLYTGNFLGAGRPAGERRPWLAFVVNLKNAKTLGLTIPQTLLATADEVIH